MNEDFNQTYDRRPANKRTFLWMGLEETSNEISSINEISIEFESKREDVTSSGLGWIPFDENQSNEFQNENKPEIQTKKLKRMEMGLSWVPLGENYVNTAPIDNDFVVPQRLPQKLKKKLTPLKVTPARRLSGGTTFTTFSLRRATFRVTPRSKTHLNFLTASTSKKRRSSGADSTLLKTSQNKSSSDISQTPSHSKARIDMSVEDIQYISWINLVLAPKKEEKADKIDSNQLILDCFNSNKTTISVCPTKEKMSVETYRESIKWNHLRSNANTLYRSAEMTKINNKIMSDIRKEKYYVRKDRAIHADIGIRKHIMELLLSYNPLWLRIGLETIFQQKIDITYPMAKCLGKFIAQNLLESKDLMAKYGHKTLTHFLKDDKTHQSINEAKKYILSKFFILLNFLDRAKQVRLIEHNPCLFRRVSQYKSTMDLIISFCRETGLTGIGDITKYLRVSGFSIGYRQTAIEEFDFEANNLAIDLRCGIRLARIAEIITDHKDLLSKLLFPANNITRKLHNVEVALKALGDIVPNNICAKDIVTGHRKKTYQLMHAVIFKHKENEILKEEKLFEQTVVFVQHLFRTRLQMKAERTRFLRLKYFTVLLQKRFRENKTLRFERRQRIKEENSVLLLQRKFRANRLMKTERKHFEKLKHSVISIQQIFRANRLMKEQKSEFERLKYFTVWTQMKFRANAAMKRDHQVFQMLKLNTIFIQRKFKANEAMKRDRHRFETLKSATILVQRKFRANSAMKRDQQMFQTLKANTIFIQRIYRSNTAMKRDRHRFETLKSATILVQRRFRANSAMKRDQQMFETLKLATISIQRRFRANSDMKRERKEFEALKLATISTQTRFRANRLMRTERKHFEEMKRSVIYIQQIFRANRLMKEQKSEFERLKYYTVWTQRKFRANIAMKPLKQSFEELKSSTLYIQRRFRANTAMKRDQQLFQTLKSATILIQRRFRANRLMKNERNRFEKLKNWTIYIQRMFRANRLMKEQKYKFQRLKESAVWIQRKFRANAAMKRDRQIYQNLKSATIWVQIRFRANYAMKRDKQMFEILKLTAVFIQRRFRVNRAIKKDKQLKYKYCLNKILSSK